MDIKVNQASAISQPEATQPVREADGAFKFTLISHIEEQELQAPENHWCHSQTVTPYHSSAGTVSLCDWYSGWVTAGLYNRFCSDSCCYGKYHLWRKYYDNQQFSGYLFCLCIICIGNRIDFCIQARTNCCKGFSC